MPSIRLARLFRSKTYGRPVRLHKRRGAIAALTVLAAGLLAAGAAPVLAQSGDGSVPRVVILGDSLTQGFGLPPEDGFVPQLARWLNDNGAPPATLVNAGVSGDTTAGGLSRLDWTLAEPVDAMVVELGGNDLLRGLDPAMSRANLDAILKRLEAEGIPVLLTGLPAPNNYGPEFADAFNAMFPELADAYGASLYPDFLAGIRNAAGGDPAAARAYLQADGIHPNAEGVAKIVADIGPAVAALIERAGD
ncbi:arylesterase [Oceanomicrobium pacificus]|uniref:Arylesterase n=1 Tax=Oceanomicrobium pacificus TaxID=2692916 RepID=A0A6B0TS37_9RHOB|nr:arylesterase [Oceanomicrobium pacificus]MXU63833.1 arylesterase [Oceanomicrobium pacificus]